MQLIDPSRAKGAAMRHADLQPFASRATTVAGIALITPQWPPPAHARCVTPNVQPPRDDRATGNRQQEV
jgi:hypothetical protein